MKKPIWKYAVNLCITISCVAYLLALYYFTIGKTTGVVVNGTNHRVNLIPFNTVIDYVTEVINFPDRRKVALFNLIGNLVLTLPLPIYVAYFCRFFDKFWKILLFCLGIILGIELFQHFSGRGIMDIDDVLLNTAGVVIGYGIWKTAPVQQMAKILRL